MSEPGPSQGPTGSDRGEQTAGEAYAERLGALQNKRWKQWLWQASPYPWNLRRQRLGRTLDVGCGLGRLLRDLSQDSVGVDHNPAFVEASRAKGLTAFTTAEWPDSSEARPGSFDSLLMAHLIEHVAPAAADEIVQDYLPYLRRGGRVYFITPQERGYASDATHVHWTDFAELADLAGRNGLVVEKSFSFPFPRRLGKAFVYNEFNVLCRKP